MDETARYHQTRPGAEPARKEFPHSPCSSCASSRPCILPQAKHDDVEMVRLVEKEELHPAGDRHFPQEGMDAGAVGLFIGEAPDEAHDFRPKDPQPGQDLLQGQAGPFRPGGILLGAIASEVRAVLLQYPVESPQENRMLAGQMGQVLPGRPLTRDRTSHDRLFAHAGQEDGDDLELSLQTSQSVFIHHAFRYRIPATRRSARPTTMEGWPSVRIWKTAAAATNPTSGRLHLSRRRTRTTATTIKENATTQRPT